VGGPTVVVGTPLIPQPRDGLLLEHLGGQDFEIGFG
jgi:hypothetical protein